MTHFSDLEMHRWRDAGPGEDRERVVAHVAECADCAARYAAAIRNQPLRAEASADVDDFVAAGLRVPKRRWTVPLTIAAAALIAMFAIPLTFHRENATPDLHLRGGAIQPLAPSGTVHAADAEFVWASGVSAVSYRVEIGEGDRVIYSGDATQSRLVVPASVQNALKPGVEYWWTVSAIDGHGRRVETSPRRTFTIVQ